jgi:3-hydroxybutyryl-CoA dehydrogenase
MKKVGVIGGGVMGSGIAEVASKAGFNVVNVDTFPLGLENAKKRIAKDTGYLVSKGKITQEEADEIAARITYSDNYEAVSDCDVVIEAVPEKLNIKRDLFEALDAIVKKDAILVTNTSAIAISAIASNMENPQRCIGMHFFHPAPVMKLVEVIKGSATSQETEEKAMAFAKEIGKEAVTAPETPGFIVNRILVPMMNEAAYMVMEGSSPEDVDKAMKLGANHPMGPLELIDYTGVDIMYGTMKGLYEGFQDEKYKPCPLLEKMIAEGKCGRKTGEGFYKY